MQLCRIYAEDLTKKFLSINWKIDTLVLNHLENVRVDSGVVEGSEISMFYDPMISKLCTFSTRKSTIKEMINALDRYLIEG